MGRRRSALRFDPDRPIDHDTLVKLKELTIRAPTAFNSQPVKCVLVSSADRKKELAHAMAAPKNAVRVVDAPLTAVFLADKQAWREILPNDTMDAKTADKLQTRIKYMSGAMGGTALRAGAKIASLLAPTPSPHTPELWATKSTMLVVSYWLLTSAALDLSTSPMEGFDEARIRSAVGAQGDRYYCPIVVPTGYEMTGQQEPTLSERRTNVFVDESL